MKKSEILRSIVEFIMVPLVSYGVWTLREMSNKMEVLNINVSVIIAERALEKENFKELKDRVLILENKNK